MSAEHKALEEIVGFVMGANEFEGCWFGDKHPTRRGAWWWRAVLSERLNKRFAEDADVAALREALEQIQKTLTCVRWSDGECFSAISSIVHDALNPTAGDKP